MSELKERLQAERTKYGVTRNTKKSSRDQRPYPKTAEPALVHPFTNSIVKMRDSGTIDIFVGTDNGIRVDPGSRTINKMANHERSMVGGITRNVGRNHITNAGGNWTISAGGNAVIQAGGNVNVKGGNINVDGGNVSMKAGNFSVASGEFNTSLINDPKIEEMTEDIENLQKDVKELQEDVKDIKDDIDNMSGDITEIKDSLKSINNSISGILSRLSAVEAKV